MAVTPTKVKKGRGVSVTRAEYNIIKKLLELGLNKNEVVQATGRSWPTVDNVTRFETYESFKNRQPKPAVEASPVETKTDQLLTDVIAVLERLDKRLRFVEEHTVVEPKEKRSFKWL